MATNVVNATAQAELHQTTVMNQTRDQNMSLVSYFKVRGADNSLCFDDINQYSQLTPNPESDWSNSLINPKPQTPTPKPLPLN